LSKAISGATSGMSPSDAAELGAAKQREELSSLTAERQQAGNVWRAVLIERAEQERELREMEKGWAQDELDEQAARAAQVQADTEEQRALNQATANMALDNVAMSSAMIGQLFEGTTEGGKKAALAMFRLNQAAALTDVAIHGAVAIAKVASQSGILAPIAVPAMTALVGAQAATVVAQKPPSFHDGGVLSPDGKGNVSLTAQSGESILSRAATARLGKRGVDRMNAGAQTGGGQTIQMVYGHRVFNSFVADNMKRRDSPLRAQLDTRSRRYGQR